MYLKVNLVSFQSRADTRVEDCFWLSELCLRAAIIEDDLKLLTQKKGISVGSAVASVLSGMFLHSLDGGVKFFVNLQRAGLTFVGKFADNILLIRKCLFGASVERAGYGPLEWVVFYQWYTCRRLLTVFGTVSAGKGRSLLEVLQTYGHAPASGF